MQLENHREGYLNRDQRVPFEYITVSRYTMCPEEYITAFHVILNADAVRAMTEHLCQKFNISFKNMILHTNIRPNERSWGGSKRVKGKKVPYMSIAMDKDGFNNAWEVCHEFAHVIFYNRYKQLKKTKSDMTPHGKAFTEILDRVITYHNEFMISNDARIAASAKR